MTYPEPFGESIAASGNPGNNQPLNQAPTGGIPTRHSIVRPAGDETPSTYSQTSPYPTHPFLTSANYPPGNYPPANYSAVPPAVFEPVAASTVTTGALPASYGSQVQTQKRTGKGTIAAIVLLSILTIAGLGAGGYFWFAADRWQANATAWEQQARTHGTSVADVSTQLATTQAELATVQQHLESAQARITELANERAQLGDQQIVDQNRIDFQARLSEAAGQVASSLELCITRQDQLIEALRNPGRYTEESVANFGQQVVQFCADARTANANLQAEINR